MIKLILSDVDGTLIPLGEDHASERTMRAIERVQEAGVHFGLATGRDFVELDQLFEGNAAPYRCGILSNGKKIVVDGEVARLFLIDREALARMARLVSTYPDTFVTAYPLHTAANNPVYCIGATQDMLKTWQDVYAFTGIAVDEVPELEIIGATIACPHGQEMMEEIWKRAAQVCPEFDFLQPAPHWSDIVPKGINKGTALPMLLDELGITSDEVAMFGDANNDLAILGAVENAVVVSGGTPAAKAAAKWIIGACEDDAVAQVLEGLAVGLSLDEACSAWQRLGRNA